MAVRLENTDRISRGMDWRDHRNYCNVYWISIIFIADDIKRDLTAFNITVASNTENRGTLVIKFYTIIKTYTAAKE